MIVLAFVACKQTKYVPDGEHMLRKNKVVVSVDKLDEDEVESIIRQQPNYSRLGVKWKLLAYNTVDSVTIANKRHRKNLKLRKKNREKISKEDRINGKRSVRAQQKGKKYYTQKIIPLKDTIDPKKLLREWYKYQVGEPPVVFDSVLYEKTISQLEAYLESKGYYYGSVASYVDYRENKKASVNYGIVTGERYYIDSVGLYCHNKEVNQAYLNFLAQREDVPLIGEPFDAEELDDYRFEISKFMKNNSFYGFTPSSISYIADTNKNTMKVDLTLNIGDRVLHSKENPDSLIYLEYKRTKIEKVIFHIADTALYDGNFVDSIRVLGLANSNSQFLSTIDTLVFSDVLLKRSKELDSSRIATILYNGELFIKPKSLESLNYLEAGKHYREYFVEKSYQALLKSGVFKMIKTELEETDDQEGLTVHYFLVPAKRQSFQFEPRATNSNGYLGVSANINYSNGNLYRGAERLTLSLSGGFESQPPVFEKAADGSKTKIVDRAFNIFEIGPSLKLEIPKLFPFDVKEISKKVRPFTVISAAYNFQKRDDFTRGSFQMNYLWQFRSSKTHIFQAGFHLASVAKIINIERDSAFSSKLTILNDRFLLNAYSNQFVWQDWKFTYDYSNQESDHRKGNDLFFYKMSFDPAGNMLSLFSKYQDYNDSTDQHEIFNVPYSQFMRMDNEFIYTKPFGKERSLHLKVVVGGGVPYGNTHTSLPYDYSFYAGGANDNRGWRARALGPGAYNYLIDQDRTATQLGDVRIGGSAEFRFALNSFFKLAVFMDVGNVWNIYNDTNRVGSQISDTWFKELSLATGLGIRLDLDYFVLRFDYGIPLTNPALAPGERWIFMDDAKRVKFNEIAFNALGSGWEKLVPEYFRPVFHFGIGYPF
jgi:hypothetical protein